MRYDIDEFFLFTDEIIILYRFLIDTPIELLRYISQFTICIDITYMSREKIGKTRQYSDFFFGIKISERFASELEESKTTCSIRYRDNERDIF